METPQDFPIHEKNIQTKKKNVIRFSGKQIKSLESIFKTENKIETRKKLQLATDLGLQPRQVAIWFQNRRARWKSKQIEQDCNVLKAKYDCMYVRFDDLNKEKQSLQIQLNELKDQLKNLDTDRDVVSKQNPESSTMDHTKDRVCGDDDDERIINCSEKTEEEEELLLSWCEKDEIISYIAARAPQTTWSSASLFRQSSGTSDWWENF